MAQDEQFVVSEVYSSALFLFENHSTAYKYRLAALNNSHYSSRDSTLSRRLPDENV